MSSTVAPSNRLRTVRASRAWKSSGNARRRFPVTLHRAGDFDFPEGLTLSSRESVRRAVRVGTLDY